MTDQFNKKRLSYITKLCEGFSKLSLEEREERLIQMGYLTDKDFSVFKKESSLDIQIANQLVENVVGSFPLPLGVAVNFVIDERDYIIPMVTEENSIIASASKTAKWIRNEGEIITKTIGKLSFGQIQIPKVKDFETFKKKIESKKAEFIDLANTMIVASLVARGGGVREISIRRLERDDGHQMAVIHIMVDTCDAMGANYINQICEYLKPHVEKLTNEKVGMCILSNLVDTKITQANVIIRNIDAKLGDAISEASIFAQTDPYRAATNNKGVMNGIDAVLIATGNDWRAVEAGVHAYAAHKGRYSSITHWNREGKDLHGLLEAPIAAGIVGGVTRLHPVSDICLKILGVKSSAELERIVAAVGLVQNLAAIKALVTHGINMGHMKLHISNLAIASGATQKELSTLKSQLIKRLNKNKRITGNDVKEIINKLRKR